MVAGLQQQFGGMARWDRAGHSLSHDTLGAASVLNRSIDRSIDLTLVSALALFLPGAPVLRLTNDVSRAIQQAGATLCSGYIIVRAPRRLHPMSFLSNAGVKEKTGSQNVGRLAGSRSTMQIIIHFDPNRLQRPSSSATLGNGYYPSQRLVLPQAILGPDPNLSLGGPGLLRRSTTLGREDGGIGSSSSGRSSNHHASAPHHPAAG